MRAVGRCLFLLLTFWLGPISQWKVFAADRPSLPSAANPHDDPDGDGLSNDLEVLYGTIPILPRGYDTDGDGVPDGADGWALDYDLHPPRLPEDSYVKISLARFGIELAKAPAKSTLFDDGTFLAYKDGKLRQIKLQGAPGENGLPYQIVRTFAGGLTGLVCADGGGVFIETPNSAYSFTDPLAYTGYRVAEGGVTAVQNSGFAVGLASQESRSNGTPGSSRLLIAGVRWNPGGGSNPAALGGYHLYKDGDSIYVGDLFNPLFINEGGLVVGYRENQDIHAPAVYEAGGILTLPSASPVGWWVPSAAPTDINSADDPWIVGTDRLPTLESYSRAVLWSKVNGFWKEKFLSKHLFEDKPIPGHNHSINDRYEILGRASTGYEECWVVRNGLYRSAMDFVGASEIYSMNNHGAMLARVDENDVLLVPVEFVIYTPDTSSNTQWQDDEQKMPWGDLFVFDDPEKHSFKFKAIFSTKISDSIIEEIDVEVGIHSPGWPDPRRWKTFKLKDIGRISPDKKEVWCAVPNSKMVNEVRPQIPAESEIEYASLDWIEYPARSSFEDSDNFDKGMEARSGSVEMVSARGGGNGSIASIKDEHEETIKPWTAKANKDYLKGGGAAYIDVRLPSSDPVNDPSEGSMARALCREQVDWFYLSVHGMHSQGEHYGHTFPGGVIILPYEEGQPRYIAPEEVAWHKDLDCVIIAGCSVLDINDYNNNFTGTLHSDSPGKRWATTGPDVLLGYNYSGPADKGGGKEIAQKWVSITGSVSKIDAWQIANRSQRAWHACAIEVGEAYYYFKVFKDPIFKKTLRAKWTRVPASEW